MEELSLMLKTHTIHALGIIQAHNPAFIQSEYVKALN